MNPSSPFGVVFDCPIFLQGIVGVSGPSFACLELLESEVITVYVSPAIISELRDVLTRPKLRRKFELLTDARVEAFFNRLGRYTIFCPEVPHVFDYERDPKDTPYIDLALFVKAKYLVSRDKDLLDLMGEGAAAREFQERYPNLTILDPVQFLRLLSSLEGSQV
jgi:putative PIN family toxin of toxin-antitoxin system